MSTSKVVSLEEWKGRDTAKLLEYLAARLQVGDLPALMVQSVDRRGRARVHVAGIFKDDATKAAGAALAASVRITAASGRDDDSQF